jgi:hypothetical protein
MMQPYSSGVLKASKQLQITLSCAVIPNEVVVKRGEPSHQLTIQLITRWDLATLGRSRLQTGTSEQVLNKQTPIPQSTILSVAGSTGSVRTRYK